MGRVLSTSLLAISLCVAQPAVAFGPGIHVREAALVLDRLVAGDAHWAAVASDPAAYTYLSMGAIAPDMHAMSAALGWGHGNDLAYHLIDTAAILELPAIYHAFALGHLCHNASDASESMVVPALFSSAAIDMLDMFAGPGPEQEAEGMVEGLGDLVNGDWDRLVDLLFDLRVESPDAWAKFGTMFLWYCETGADYLGRDTNCTVALAEIDATMGQADGLLGGLGRQGSKDFMGNLRDQPLANVVDLLAGGALSSVFGETGNVEGPEIDAEVARVKGGPLVEASFWALYLDQLAELGPDLAVDRLATRRSGWPGYNRVAMYGGNVASLMRFLPEDYAVVTGLHADRLRWTGPAGAELTQVSAASAQTVTVAMRIISALPLAGQLTLRVKLDRPGLSTAADPIVAQSTTSVAIDPSAYAHADRELLVATFTTAADHADDGLGYYVEVLVDEAPLPALTSSWDRLHTIGTVDFSRDVYADLGTYGGHMPSLLLSDSAVTSGRLWVVVRSVEGAAADGAMLQRGGSARSTGEAGLALFEPTAIGEVALSFDGADRWALVAGADLNTTVREGSAAGEASWHGLTVWRLPQWAGAMPAAWDGGCVDLGFDESGFGPAFMGFEATALPGDIPLAVIDGSLCADAPGAFVEGATYRVSIRATYDNTVTATGAGAGGAMGPTTTTDPFVWAPAAPIADQEPEVDASVGRDTEPSVDARQPADAGQSADAAMAPQDVDDLGADRVSEEPTGDGCGSGGSRPAAWVLILALGVLWRPMKMRRSSPLV